MPDSNARRDKALESIDRHLGEISKQLKRIADDGRRLKFTNHPADSPTDSRPDPFDVPQQSGDDVAVMREVEDNNFPQPTHSYLRRSTKDE